MSALPKAVQQIGDAAEQAAVDAGIKPGSKPASAEPAAAPVSKVDPDNYEERYKRYKAQTDDTIADLRKQIADLTSTITEMQKQNSDLMQQLAAKAIPAADTTATSQPADPKDTEAAYKAWHDALPQKYKDDYTEDYLRDQFYFLQTMGGQQANASPDNLQDLETKVDQVMQYQEKTAQQLYEDAMDEAYPDDKWIKLTKEPDWGKFCARTVSPVDQRTYGSIVKGANESHDATSVIWVLGQYEKYKTDLDAANNETAPDPREEMITPEGGAGGDAIEEISAQADTYTVSQVQRFYEDRTKGKYTDEEFKAIEQSIIRAQNAGKIIPG